MGMPHGGGTVLRTAAAGVDGVFEQRRRLYVCQIEAMATPAPVRLLNGNQTDENCAVLILYSILQCSTKVER